MPCGGECWRIPKVGSLCRPFLGRYMELQSRMGGKILWQRMLAMLCMIGDLFCFLLGIGITKEKDEYSWGGLTPYCMMCD